MADDSLRALAQVLHDRLESAQSLEPADRASLQQLATDLNAILARSGSTSSESHGSVLGRLGEAATHFEVTHPDLTATLMQMSKALGDMGI